MLVVCTNFLLILKQFSQSYNNKFQAYGFLTHSVYRYDSLQTLRTYQNVLSRLQSESHPEVVLVLSR